MNTSIYTRQDRPSLPPLAQVISSTLPSLAKREQQYLIPFNQQTFVQSPPAPPPSLARIKNSFIETSPKSPIETKPSLSTSSNTTTTTTNTTTTTPKTYLDKCTCKNEGNHIPRPRNAFILFRQQHHQSVLDEGNVVKTNPDVSRELGKRWRDLSPTEKDYWNKLAEEEKKKHAQKYPGYRYIPRKFGKKGGCPFCKAKGSDKQRANEQKQEQDSNSNSNNNKDTNNNNKKHSIISPNSNHSEEQYDIAQSFLNLRNQTQHYLTPPHSNPIQYDFSNGHQSYSTTINLQPNYIRSGNYAPQNQIPSNHSYQQHLISSTPQRLPPLAHFDAGRSANEIHRLPIPVSINGGATITGPNTSIYKPINFKQESVVPQFFH